MIDKQGRGAGIPMIFKQKWLLGLGLLLFSCTPLPTGERRQIPSPAALLSTVADEVTLHIRFPASLGFATQAVDLTQIKYLRSWVKGKGIPGQLWNSEGFVNVSGNPQATLSMGSVPKGRQRIVAAQGYDVQQQPIPGTLLMAFYDSPPLSRNVTVHLKWRFVPIGSVMEHLLQTQSALLEQLDLNQLQHLLDQMMYGDNPIGGSTYALHPSRLNVSAIVAYLQQNNGKLPEAPPNTWLTVLAPNTLTIRNPQNLPFNSPITVKINDPASTAQTLAMGQEQLTLPQMGVGTWNITASLAGLNGGVSGQTSVTVSSEGAPTLASNPLLLPPVLTAVNPPPNPPVTIAGGLISHWTAENHANDRLKNNSGTLKNGASFTGGMWGQAFHLDGVNDFIAVDDADNHNFGTGGFTLLGWAKTTSNSQNPIFSKYNNGLQGWMLSVHTGKAYFFNRNSAGVTVAEFFGSRPVADGQWHFIVGRRSGSQYCLFVDGSLESCITRPSADDLDNNKPLYIGQFPVTWNFPFNGQLDDLMIYNRGLSDAEIETLYKNRAFNLQGDGFHTTASSNTLTVSGQSVAATMATSASLWATLQPTWYDSRSVAVTASNKTSNSGSFTVPPIWLGTSRVLGIAGQNINLFGQGFGPVATHQAVTFNGQSAPVATATTTQLTVTIPTNVASGPLQLQTSAGLLTGPQFTPMPSGLISWWQAEGNGQDLMGLNHGNLANGTLIGPGQVEQGYKLDGVDDCVVIPDSASLDFANSHSVGAWVKSTNGAGMIAAKHFTHGSRTTTLYMSGGRFQFTIYQPDNTGFTLTSNAVVNANQLYHVMATYDKTSGVANIYVNGALDNTANFGSFDVMQTNIPFTIGCYLLSADGSVLRDFTSGMLDEVLLFNRALTAAEVQVIYQASS